MYIQIKMSLFSKIMVKKKLLVLIYNIGINVM